MANPFYQGNAQPPQMPQAQQGGDFMQQISANPQAYVADIKARPQEFLRRCGLSVPDGMTDPMQIFRHLVQTGQRRLPGRR